MTKPIPVVDLFAGPGGLAEGFSAFREPAGAPGFRVALSIEKDEAAHRTLRPRAFLRKFGTGFPPQYYEFLNGATAKEPDWSTLYPNQWSEACKETKCMELGRKAASDLLWERIERLRDEHGGRTVLLGGPPCQSYSVVGRSRNAGNLLYDPDRDKRQALYKEYVRVLRRLQPAMAIMENVKGMLSARHGGQRVFQDVMKKLQRRSQSYGYRLFALASRSGADSWDGGAEPTDFLVHAEEHGVPQTVYEGALDEAEEPHGPGRMTWADGTRFLGVWEHGRAVSGQAFVTTDRGTRMVYAASQDADGKWILERPYPRFTDPGYVPP